MHKALLMALLVALAGCADAPAEPTEADPVVEEAEPGDLRGVVVTDAIVPIEGATVTLFATKETRVTDEDGAFVFEGLEAGDYVVEARAPGYLARQGAATIDGDTEAIRIVLPVDPDGIPFVETHVWQGYLTCSAYVVAALVAACDALGQAGVTDDEFTTLIDVRPNIRFVQSELIWEPSQELGDVLQMIMSYASQSTHEAGSQDGDFYSATGQSPILLKIPGESAQAIDLGNTYELKPRVFAGRSSQAQQMAGVSLQQDFTLYTHAFHGYSPPGDWRFSEDRNVPQP